MTCNIKCIISCIYLTNLICGIQHPCEQRFIYQYSHLIILPSVHRQASVYRSGEVLDNKRVHIAYKQKTVIAFSKLETSMMIRNLALKLKDVKRYMNTHGYSKS